MRAKSKTIIIMIALSIAILNSSLILSLSVMSIYNKINIANSNIDLNKMELNIPYPKGKWHPMMNVFTINNFSYGLDREIDLAIYYSFGHFKVGSSALFDPEDCLFNSFYGCYVIKDKKMNYGFTESGDANLYEIGLLPEYDFKYLVGGALGLEKENYNLEYEVLNQQKSDNEILLEFKIDTNSIYHRYEGFKQNYIQYGKPYIIIEKENFYTINLYSKMKLVKYSGDISIIYYIFSTNEDIVKTWKI